MEQQRQTDGSEPRFDRTQAEEALLIAARLQQEHQDQFSLSDLKRTAAEVDIRPEFVERAISMVKQEPKPVVVPAPRPTILSFLANLAMGFVVVVTELLLAGFACVGPHVEASAWALAPVLTGLFAWKLRKGASRTSRGATLIALAFAFILVWITLMSSVFHDEGIGEILIRLTVLATLQLLVYFGVRWLVDSDLRPGLTWSPRASEAPSGVRREGADSRNGH